MADGYSKLAKLFKDRENPKQMGIMTGTVIEPPPEPKIRIDENIVLDKQHLIFDDDLTIEKDDEVIIIPAGNQQVFYVLAKARRF
ncbi:DUF2577 family protein [Salsuginibacillus kocurii]|uniref:DUF2577 family protein n=1 Tax=Salsuginibacillus kocurii TaxID=427078 RepID=UPI00035E3B17|nr:DUF2577 family protein [Salsuginibacillus kocurii]